MTIDDIEHCKMDEQLSYILGMCYPLYKEIFFDNTYYLLGACNHNKIKSEDLVAHILVVRKFLNQSNSIKKWEMFDNSKIKNIKKGFSILIKKNKAYKYIFNTRVKEVLHSTDDIKKMFIRGCFDGRASWDTSRHYISIDVDRDDKKQNLISKISLSLGIELNINNREENSDKNDQIRVVKKCVDKFLDDIGFFSIYRENVIRNNIKLKDL